MVMPTLQRYLEHFGIAVSAITGVLAARGKRIDLFGVLVLALVTAFGGGTVRDLLAGDLPVVWLRSPEFLLNATSIALLTFFTVRMWNLPHNVLLIADAFALALFSMLGARKGIALGFSPPVIVLLGVITGVAGGIIRDVLTGEVPLVFQPEIHLYATAALAGATAFVTLVKLGVDEPIATPLGLAMVLGLRLLGIRWRLTLPLFESHRLDSEHDTRKSS
jgi:uncharacterized membrane protein YeiH